MGQFQKLLAIVIAALIFGGLSGRAQAQSIIPYYVETGQTGAQTQIDTNHKSSFTIRASSEIDFYGGKFVMKAGSSASAPLTLTLYDSAAKTNVLASITLTRAQFCAIHGGNCSSYDVTRFEFPSPIRLIAGRAYFAELTSPAPDTQSQAYFIKGGNSCYIASGNGTTLPDSQCSYTYTPSTGGQPNLQIAKSGPPTANAGEPYSYTLTVKNAGDGAAATATVKDQLPSGLSFVSASGVGWSCSASGRPALITCQYAGSIAARGGTSTITVKVTGTEAGTYVNWASVDPTGGTVPTNPGPTSCAGLSNTICDSASTIISAATPDLSIEKLAPAPPLAPNTTSTYTLNVSNAGIVAATTAQVKDQLPAGMTFVSAAGTGWICAENGGLVTCDFTGRIAPGEMSSIAVSVSLPPGASGSFENRAFVNHDGTPINSLPGTCTSDTVISCSSNTSAVNSGLLKISKSAPNPELVVGVESIYTIRVRNIGGATVNATTADLKDLMPAYLDLVDVSAGWTCTPSATSSPASSNPVEVRCRLDSATSIPVNDTVALRLTVKPRSGVAETVTNYAAVDPTGGNTPPSPGPDCNDPTSCTEETSNVTPAMPDLIVSKEAPIPALQSGAQSTYPINVRNEGDAAATFAQVKDQLPSGMIFVSASGSGWTCAADGAIVTCDFRGIIAPGDSSPINVVVRMPDDATSGSYENRAFVKRDGTPINTLPGTCATTATISCSANTSSVDEGLLQIEKSGPESPLQVGVDSTYTITVTNIGGSAIRNTSAHVKDLMPAYVDLVSVSPGWVCTPGSTESPVSNSAVELACSLNSPTIIGVNRSRILELTVRPRARVATSVTNYASVAPDGGPRPPSPGPDCTDATSCAQVTTSADPSQPDLKVSKSAPSPALRSGKESTYTISVENKGQTPATSVQFKDRLPTGMTFVSASGSGWACTDNPEGVVTCNYRGLIESGDANSVDLTVSLPSDASGTYENVAFVNRDGTPISRVADDCGLSAAISCSSNTSTVGEGLLQVDKSAPTPPLQVGAESTYSITVTNVGGGPIKSTRLDLKDLLPAYLDLVDVSPGWTCSPGSTTAPDSNTAVVIGCELVSPMNIAINGTKTLQLTVKPRAGVAGTVTNYAAVDPTGGNVPLDPGPSCNDATSCAGETSSVDPAFPELSVEKLAPVPALKSGGQSTYTIHVRNDGSAAASPVQVKDRLPDGMNFEKASGAGWNCRENEGVVTCNYSGSIAPGESSTIEVDVSLPEGASGIYENRAFVNRDGSPIKPLPDDCNSDAIISCSSNSSAVDRGLLKIEKSQPNPALRVGEESTYTLTVTNVGGDPLVGTTAALKDLMPAFLDLVAVSPGWNCTPDTTKTPASNSAVEIACALATPVKLGVNETKTLELTVKPRTGVSASVTNYASVDPDGGETPPDPGPGCTDATSCTEQTSEVDPSAPELSVEKLAPVPALAAGAQSTYKIIVENTGSAAAVSAQVKDRLPEGMSFVSASGAGWLCGESAGVVICDATTRIKRGASSSFEVVVSLPVDATGTYENRAYVNRDGRPVGPVPRETCETDATISCSSNTSTVGEGLLRIEKSAPSPALQVGAESDYTITVTNVGGGPIDVTRVNLKDLMPAYLDFVSASPGWECTPGETAVPASDDDVEIACALATPVKLDVNETKTLELTVKPRTGVSASVTNYASVDPDGGETPPDPGPGCTDATSCTEQTSEVDPPAPLRIEKTSSDATFVVNADAHYSLKVTNGIASRATDVTIVEDQLPSGMSFVSASGSGWLCTDSGKPADGVLITCKAEGPISGTSEIAVVARPGPSLAGQKVTNWTSVGTGKDETAAQPPKPYQCTEQSVCDSVERSVVSVGYRISKSKPSPDLEVGKRSVYTISVTTEAANLATEVKDQLPDGMMFVSANGKGWACQADTGNLVTCKKAISSGETEEISVEVEVGASLNKKKVTNYASVGPEGGAPEPGPRCKTDASADVCASSTAKVADIRDKISKAVEEDVQAFMASRLDRLASFAGRGSRLQHFRNTNCGWNHDGSLNGDGTEKTAQFNGAASADLRLPGKMVVPTADVPPEACGGLNIWAELEFDYVAGAEGANSQTALATLGLEYLLTPSILAGVRATFDYTDFDMDGASDANSQITGQGWFAGPYVSAEIVQNVFFDAFAGYGTSWNDYSGKYEMLDLAGDFTTQRLLAAATLTGQFESGAFLFSPSAGVAYGKEWSDSFNVKNSDIGAIRISGETVELTRLSAEFETAYRTTVGDGNPFELFISPNVTYDFFQNAGPEAENILGGDFRGGVDGGFRFSDGNFDMSLRVGYDGIGVSDWNAYQGELQVNYTW